VEYLLEEARAWTRCNGGQAGGFLVAISMLLVCPEGPMHMIFNGAMER
jgi:hypothetical protein